MQTRTKKEVSNRGMQGVIDSLIEKKFDMNIFLEGIPYDLEYIKNRHERIEWWVYCKIISNLRPYFTQIDFEEMNRTMVSRGKYIEGVLFGFFLFGSNKLARYFHKQIWKLGEFTFSNIKQKTEFLDKNKIRVYAILDEGYEFPVEFAYFTKGAWDEFASIVGRKGFKVEFTVSKRLITFIATWDKEGFFFRITRVIQWFFNIKTVLFEVTDTHSELQQQYNKLQESKWTLEKQTKQLKTAYEISKSIKQTPHIRETLEIISKTLLMEAGFSALIIEIFKDIDDNDLEIKVITGEITDSMISIKRELIIDEKHLGYFTAFADIQTNYQDMNELVDYIIPLINIAVYNSLVLRAIVDYRDNLEQKVSERTIELKTARDKLEFTNKLLKEAQLIQNRFFANISHEFRTPLTLILGPAKQIIEKVQDEKIKHDVSLIYRNGKKLLELVNQLLDISKLESGKMKLETNPLNIIQLLKALVLSFTSYAERKRITLKFNSVENEIIVYVDKDKFEKIMTNILSNAFKFTPEGGSIDASVSKDVNYVIIKISDTGVGIPHEKRSKIFDRFYQVDTSHTRENEGTGIGLSLTKELIDLHKGKIEVESKEGRGSTFTVRIPLGKKHLKPEEIVDEEHSYDLPKLDLEEEIEQKIEFSKKSAVTANDSLPTLLLVEDNFEVRNYIKDNLMKDYRILEAVDGEDGWNKSIELIPDLIVSDVMMPKMDGFKLCEKLKTDEITSHIPVILLTAKATRDDKITGFETGADEYLMKPFEPDELKARIKNLIEQRKRLHEHFRKEKLPELNHTSLNALDKVFIQKVYDVIKDNISDTEFNMDNFAERLLVSKSLLYKKMVSLTGEPPVEFIRRIRLNKAAALIENNSENLSGIAMEVGFSNPAYFSECFKKQFGVSPSQYKRNKKIS
jgi:signal transduction histidine kinase/DNA-binding response OmpR family regulator